MIIKGENDERLHTIYLHVMATTNITNLDAWVWVQTIEYEVL